MARGTTRQLRPRGVRGSLLALICLLCLGAALAPAMASAATERGNLEGVVPHDGSPLSGIEVRLAGPEELSTLTDVAGEYSFTGILEGEYTVYFKGAPYAETSVAEVAVAENQTTVADAELAEAGTLAGTVVDSVTLDGIEGVEVCASPEGSGSGGCAATDDHGEYELDLAEGEYEVEISHAGYATQTLRNVEVEEGETNAIDFSLERNGEIEGLLEDSAGAPIAHTMVCVNGSNGDYFNTCVFTDENGEYATGEVPPYEYEVEFTGLVCDTGAGCATEECELMNSCTRPYVPLIFEDGVIFNNGEATLVPVAPGEVVSGVDGELASGGKIEGKVTLAGLAGAPLAGIKVSAFPATANARSEQAVTDASGEYTIEGLTEAEFLVRFEEVCEEPEGNVVPECPRAYATQWYAGVSEEEDATPIPVAAATTQSEIDAAMVEVAPTTPAFAANPSLSGGTAVGSTLTCSPGAWTHNPTSLSYAWQRNGAAIAGQAGDAYVVTSSDEGASLTCAVTIANSAGSVSATSNAVAIPAATSTGTTTTTTSTGSGSTTTSTPTAKPATGPSTATAKGSTVTLTLKCSGEVACKGSLKLVYEEKTTKNGKTTVKKITIGSLNSFSVPAGKSKAIKVKLTSKGKSLLAEAGKKGLKVKLTGSGVKARSLTLKSAS